MNDKHTIKRSAGDRRKGKTDWKRVDALSEEEREEAAQSDPDAQPTTEDFWHDAVIVMPEPKKSVTLRLDQDMLEWYKKQGRGYQTRMNAALRAFMEAQKKGGLSRDHHPEA